jgi:hypothetical protein
MHKNAMKCNETLSKWCKNKHGASKIMDTLETYHTTSIIYVNNKHGKVMDSGKVVIAKDITLETILLVET